MSDVHNDPNASKAHVNRLEETLDLYLVKKAPALPQRAKEFIVKIAPGILILLIVYELIATFSFLFALGLGGGYMFSFLPRRPDGSLIPLQSSFEFIILKQTVLIILGLFAL